MGLGHQAGAEALARQTRQFQDKMAERQARMRRRMHDNQQRYDDDPTLAQSAEALACPACSEQFDFGNTCPTCNVPLTSASFVHTASDDPHQGRRITGRTVVHMLVVATLTWVAFMGLVFLGMSID